MSEQTSEQAHVDVLIVGAGLSGIGAAARLAISRPQTSYLVLEARAASGGTWDLFRYPGIRSDSDMYTLGYRFKPWRGEKALADAPAILAYVRETAQEYGVEQRTRYEHKVTAADWDSTARHWVVTAETPQGRRTFTASFLWGCSGYYDYDAGYTPAFPGRERFRGQVIHPQHWPDDLDHHGKRVVVIGSGATAVTLVPALVEEGAGHVTMLQRSPTYVLSMPAVDPVARLLQRWLPERTSYRLTRWKNILVATALYRLARRSPGFVRRVIRKQNVALLPEGYDVDTHFKPRYDPWDQRLCLVPDADLFKVLRGDRAEVVTDTIEEFDETGIRLASGRHLDADVIVTATGLELKFFGGGALSVDGVPVKPHELVAYRALMLSGLPNLAFTVGYTNASWTLKADLVAEFVCRLLDHMDAHGHSVVTPVVTDDVDRLPFLDFQSGYVQRALDRIPQQGAEEPWRLRQNYLYDVRTIRRGELDDGALVFD